MNTKTSTTHSALTTQALAVNTTAKRVVFRLAGYAFTYRRSTQEAKVRIDMWREDELTGERHWITLATCAPNSKSARSVALALAAWVKSCNVGIKRDVKAQAIAESWALLQERLSNQVQAQQKLSTEMTITPVANDQDNEPAHVPQNDNSTTQQDVCDETPGAAA